MYSIICIKSLRLPRRIGKTKFARLAHHILKYSGFLPESSFSLSLHAHTAK